MKKFSLTQYTLAAMTLVLILAGLQLASPALENPPVTSEAALPADVKHILKRACYDCHSNESRIAWYDRIAPVSYLVAEDIREARSRFNFSEWDKNPPAVRELLLWEMVNAVAQKKMPLKHYTRAHPDGNVSAAELAVLKRYVNTLPGRHKIDNLQSTVPVPKPQNVANNPPPVSLNGIAYSAEYKNWKVISVTDKFDGGSMRVAYGNDIMVRAIEKGTLPFPDGAKIVKVVWGKQSEDQDGNVAPGHFQNVQFMIKDSKKYSQTEGWGFAKFDGPELKPAGKTILFQQTCINCHRLLATQNDFVFNIPTK